MKIGNTNMNDIRSIITQIKPDTRIQSSDANNQNSGTEIPGFLSEDTVVISAEGKEKSDSFQSKLEELRNRYRTLSEELKRAEAVASGMAEQCKEKIRCMRIAMRIISGGKVPIEDQRYLAEKDMELYAHAMSMRVEKEDPEEYDRLSEDEKTENGVDVNDPAAGDTAVGDTDTDPAEVDATAEVSSDTAVASSEV